LPRFARWNFAWYIDKLVKFPEELSAFGEIMDKQGDYMFGHWTA